ncbi:MAG: AMP-binding protein, partial [Bacteroidetes bacterium]|nr:AMP-binding protein [Bacteroidota bacterium]
MIDQLRAIKKQIEAIPQNEHILPQSILEILKEANQRFSSKQVIRYFFEGKNYKNSIYITFQELFSQIIQTANLLNGLGVKSEDHIAVILPRIPEAPVAVLGSSMVGKVYCVEPSLPAHQIAELLKQADPKVLICPGPFPGLNIWEVLETVRPHLPNLEFILQTDLTDYLGKFKKMTVRMNLRNQGKAEKVAGQQLGDFNRSKEKMPGDSLNFTPESSEVFGVFHSSGQNAEVEFWEIELNDVIFSAWASAQYFQGETLFHDLSPTLPGAINTGVLASCFSGQMIVFGDFMGESYEEMAHHTLNEKQIHFSALISHQDSYAIKPLYEGDRPSLIGFEIKGEEILLPYQYKNYVQPESEYQIPFTLLRKIFCSHSSVNDAWIIPQPDIKGHWVPIAYLSLTPGTQPDLRAIYDFVVEKLTPEIPSPQGIRIVEKFQQTPLGTIQLYPLIQAEIQNAILREIKELGVEEKNIQIISTKSGIQSWKTEIIINSLLSDIYQKISDHFSSFPFPINLKIEA